MEAMPRAPRAEIAGGIHHVISRGNRHQLIVHTDADRRLFLAELERAVGRRRWRCLTYCLMTNHFHLVIETPEPNLGAGMREFLGRFAQTSNLRHGTDGHMFKERFRSVHVATDEHFAYLLRYVVLNPVNAGLCRDPRDWRWSSHARMSAGRDGPLAAFERVEELLACWGGARGTRYAALLAPLTRFGTWSDASSSRPPRPRIETLLDSMPLQQAMIAARRDHGYRLSEIAAAAGVSESTVCRRTRV
jgi:putative transposase